MNTISERDFHLLGDAVRRRHRATCTAEQADVLERHAFRVLALADDLAEGESLNALDYQVMRAAAILHEGACGKSDSTEASAVLAAELLDSIGADHRFAAATVQAIRRHRGGDAEGEEPTTCPEQIVHDACLLARLETRRLDDDAHAAVSEMHLEAARLCTHTARRIAAQLLDTAEMAATARIG